MDAENAEIFLLSCHSVLKKLKLTDADELNVMIDRINALNICDCNLDDEITEEILCYISKLVPQQNDHMLAKFSSLVSFFLHKHKKTLSPSCTQCLVEFFIPSLKTCGEWVQTDVLIAFSELLRGNCDEFQKLPNVLLENDGILSELLVPCKQDERLHYHAFQCLQALLQIKGYVHLLKDNILGIYCQKCILTLKQKIESNSSDIISLKILIICLKCLQLLFQSKSVPLKNFGELLGVLKCNLFHGLPGPCLTDTYLYPSLKCPDAPHLEESNDSESSSYPKLRKQKRNRRSRSKKTTVKIKTEGRNSGDNVSTAELKNVANCRDIATPSGTSFSSSSHRKLHDIRTKSSSSDSEYSDAESQVIKIRNLQASVRQNAYHALQAVIKVTDKKIMFGYWSSFLPDFPNIPGMINSQNIFSTILKDPASQVRLSALSVLVEMLKGSKHFLSYADGRHIGHLSFTSMSAVLASIITEIHRCLLLALLAENSAVLLIQILKCYAVLCENVPYTKINLDVLLKLLKHIKNFLFHKDSQIQAACLNVFGAIVNSDQIPENIVNIILAADFDLALNSFKDISVKQDDPALELPWIICFCKHNIFTEKPLPLQIESFQLLSSIVGKYFSRIVLSLYILEDIIIFCLNGDRETSIELYGVKLLDVFGRCINNYLPAENIEAVKPCIKKLWLSISERDFIRCLTDNTQPTLQSVCCDCLSTLPSNIFEELPKKNQILYITVVLGLASDVNPNLRGSAIRCLGIYSLFPCLIEDLSFLNDVADKLIKSVDDPNLNVRFKASWSLGNLSDALFLNKDKSFLSQEISAQFFYSIGMTCIQFSKDCDRIKANAVRALGNFLNFVPSHFLDIPMVQDFVKIACSSLKLALTSNVMKVCWNTCYAFGNLFKNSTLINHKIVDLEDMLNSLLKTLNSPNFKVRISAAQALTVLKTREIYGNLFSSIWLQLVSAIFSAATDGNFSEIKHKENLCDQLCYSICQLALVLTNDDLCDISKDTIEASEMLLTSFWKFGLRTAKDKIEILCCATEHLTFLMNENKDNAAVLSLLQDILNQAIIAFYGQIES